MRSGGPQRLRLKILICLRQVAAGVHVRVNPLPTETRPLGVSEAARSSGKQRDPIYCQIHGCKHSLALISVICLVDLMVVYCSQGEENSPTSDAAVGLLQVDTWLLGKPLATIRALYLAILLDASCLRLKTPQQPIDCDRRGEMRRRGRDRNSRGGGEGRGRGGTGGGRMHSMATRSRALRMLYISRSSILCILMGNACF